MQRGIFIAAILALAGVLFGPYGCHASERGASPAKAPPIPPITPETVTSAAETIQILRGSSLAMLPGGSEPPTWENQYGRDYVPILDLAEGDGGDIFACTGTHGLVHLTSEAGGALRPVAAHFPGELETTKPGFGRCERVTAHGTDVFAAHRGDWFVPQSHIAHRRMQNGRLEDVALLRLEASVEDIAGSGRTLFAALHEEGIQRFRKRAVKRAAIEMDERRRIEFNENYDNKLKAKLARVSTILAARERELVKMKGLASPEDETF